MNYLSRGIEGDNMNDIINSILQSSVIGAIVPAFIAAVVSLMTNKKARSLKYVTGERQAWRDKIREIAVMLNYADYKETRKALAELKIRINAFGNCKNGEYMNDAHIWCLIHEMEDEKLTLNELYDKQKLLIEYLSLLLKYDWERSKKEINGDLYRIAALVMYAFTTIAFFAYGFMYKIYELPRNEYILYMIGLIVMIICAYVVYNIILDSGINSIQRIIERACSNKHKVRGLFSCYALYVAVNIVIVVIFSDVAKGMFIINDIQEYATIQKIQIEEAQMVASQMKLCVFVLMILYVCGAVLYTISKIVMLNLRYDYINEINELKNRENENITVFKELSDEQIKVNLNIQIQKIYKKNN